MFTKAVVAAILAFTAQAHMVIVAPVPFDPANLNNSPLAADGSDFPCKNADYSKADTVTKYAVGGKGQLALKGSAVHGGGSCQLSVTMDLEPTKDSVWKVIKSIEGGCPARNAAGNLPANDPSFPDPDTYDFVMPKLPSGKATLAWTWHNKIGNREMYMNCAPIEITGSGGSAEVYNALPDMFVANLGNGCATTEGVDLVYPNPGADVDRIPAGSDTTRNFGGPSGNCPAAKGGSSPAPAPAPAPSAPAPSPNAPAPSPNAPAPSPSAPAPAPSAPAPSPNAPAPAAPTPSTPSPSAAAAPAPAVYPPAESSPAAPAPAAPAPAAPAPAAPAPDTPAPDTPAPATPSAGTPAGSCTENGWKCIDGKTYSRCVNKSWDAAQPMASGTKCNIGETIDSFPVLAARKLVA